MKRSIPLLNAKAVKNRNMEVAGLNWNFEKRLRELSKEEKIKRMELIKIVMENNIKILEMQKKINELKKRKKRERKRRERKM